MKIYEYSSLLYSHTSMLISLFKILGSESEFLQI
jgi:hypothetical protein